MKVNNIELIKDLLEFNEGDFYQLYVMTRRKDLPLDKRQGVKDVRIIKSYSIHSIEYLDMRWEEITKLANFFGARVYIEVNPKNHLRVSYEMVKVLGDRFTKGLFKQNGIFDITAGESNSRLNRWVIDIDVDDENFLNEVIDYIQKLEPLNKGNKILATLRTKNGYHLITERFDSRGFIDNFGKDLVEIKKRVPTLLYW
jgi:hypothetical protein